MDSRTLIRFASGVAVLLCLGAPARAQTVTLDEGVFRLLVGGREAGTETFWIRRTGTGAGATVIANGSIVPAAGSTHETIRAQLQVASETLRPVSYEVKIRADTIRGRIVGRRARATVTSTSGENVREYLVSEGAILAEEGVAHHHYFVVQRAVAGATRLPLIVPSESRQTWAAVEVGTTGLVSIGGQTIEARRISIQPEAGAERIVWVDGEGRVLRLEVPARNLVAERIALPH